MKKTFLILFLLICQTFFFAQDNKVMKIAKYINKGKWQDARELLDELDNNPKYKNDIDYWFVRTCYYRDAVTTHIKSDKELYKIEIVEAKKSLEKLFELDKTDSSKAYSSFIPQIKKEIYNGQNETIDNSSNKVQSESSKPEEKGKTVTLTEIGQGKTKDDAKYNALRNALEKAFGTFISSNTTIFKDELVKDEIVSVSSGNIQNFEILSETQMPDGSYTSVVKATVSIGKLTSFCESKGIAVEFKGGLFAANIKLKELNKKNEIEVINNLYKIIDKISEDIFDYSIEVAEPQKKFKNYESNFDEWELGIAVKAKMNDNINSVADIITKTITSLSLSGEEVISYRNQNISTYTVKIIQSGTYYLRSEAASKLMNYLFLKIIPSRSKNFRISNGITNNKCSDIMNCIRNNEICTDWYEPKSKIINVSYPIYFKYSNRPDESNADGHETADRISSFLYGYDIFGDKYDSGDIHFSFEDNDKIVFEYNFRQVFSVENLSKISEYKVEPIKLNFLK